MRLIDADALNIRKYTRWFENEEDVRQVKRMIREAPTITRPPNAPLTLEQLWEMDGEPVWVVTGSAINAGRGHWDICDWWDKNTVMFPYSGEQPRIDDCGITWFAYSRKPEDGTT